MLITESEARGRAQMAIASDRVARKSAATRSAATLLSEAKTSFSALGSYDIFLSHCMRDADLVLGAKGVLEDLGYKVYVDWLDDPQMDRSRVTAATAAQLRQRMRNSSALFFLTSMNATSSTWMPWECGYFDGFREKVAILPLAKTATSTFIGQEYLGLYPYAMPAQSTGGDRLLFIHADAKRYLTFKVWVTTPTGQLAWRTT